MTKVGDLCATNTPSSATRPSHSTGPSAPAPPAQMPRESRSADRPTSIPPSNRSMKHPSTWLTSTGNSGTCAWSTSPRGGRATPTAAHPGHVDPGQLSLQPPQTSMAIRGGGLRDRSDTSAKCPSERASHPPPVDLPRGLRSGARSPPTPQEAHGTQVLNRGRQRRRPTRCSDGGATCRASLRRRLDPRHNPARHGWNARLRLEATRRGLSCGRGRRPPAIDHLHPCHRERSEPARRRMGQGTRPVTASRMGHPHPPTSEPEQRPHRSVPVAGPREQRMTDRIAKRGTPNARPPSAPPLILLPDQPPPLTPGAARALLRILQTASERTAHR